MDNMWIFRGKSDISGNEQDLAPDVELSDNIHDAAERIYVSDDDVQDYSINIHGRIATSTPKIRPLLPDLSYCNDRNIFPRACVEVVADTSKDSNDVNFDLHVENRNETGKEKKDIYGGDDYWVATVCVAYQYIPIKSADGNTGQGTVHGTSNAYCWTLEHPQITSNPTTEESCGSCVIFIEATRDSFPVSYATILRRAIAHEIGHLFNGRHDRDVLGGNLQPYNDDGLMAEQGVYGITDFSGRTLRRIMLMRKIGPSILNN